MFEVRTRDLGGRIGKLATKHGVIETPFLFPVIDLKRQIPDLVRIKSMGFNGVITNAYLLYKRSKGIAKSVHSELAWNNVIMTDSGGYQVLVYGDIDVSNRTIVEYEKNIGSDIAVILDVPTGSRMSFEEAQKAVYETYKRGIESLPLIMDADQLWVYPVQGAPFRDLLERSAILANKLPYDMYAVGSPTVMLEKYEYSKLVELVITARTHLPPDKPLHVFGVGHPMIIPFLVAVGGDTFDSASYVLYARDGRYMVETGTKNIRDLEHFPCNCPVCSRYTPRDLLEMPAEEREEAIAAHNLFMLIKEIRTVKEAIKEGRLWELLEYKSRAHPALLRALYTIKRHTKLLEKTTPTSNPKGKAILIYDEISCENPKLRANVRRALSQALKEVANKVVVLIPAYKKPYTSQIEYRSIVVVSGEHRDVVTLFIHPMLGVFKPEIASTYPFYQHEFRFLRKRVYANLKRISHLIEKVWRHGAREILIVQAGWLEPDIAREVNERLLSEGMHVIICKLDEIFSLFPP